MAQSGSNYEKNWRSKISLDLCYSPNVFRFLITFVRIFSVQSNGRIRLQPNNSTQAHNKNKNMLDYLNGCLEPLKQRIKQLSSTAAPPVTTADYFAGAAWGWARGRTPGHQLRWVRSGTGSCSSLYSVCLSVCLLSVFIFMNCTVCLMIFIHFFNVNNHCFFCIDLHINNKVVVILLSTLSLLITQTFCLGLSEIFRGPTEAQVLNIHHCWCTTLDTIDYQYCNIFK